MPGPNLNLEERKAKREAKERRVAIRDASFRLYKILDSENLSPIGSFETMSGIIEAYGKALDEGIPQEQLEGHKTKVLEFKVKEIERKIRAS